VKCGWVSDVTASIAKLEETQNVKKENNENNQTEKIRHENRQACPIHPAQPRGKNMKKK